MTKGLRKGFCLCHGNSGNVHIMLESALKQGNDKIVKICEIYLHNMAKKIYENKLELLPQERFDFGLMNGIACKLRSNGMPVPLLRNGYSIFNGTKYR